MPINITDVSTFTPTIQSVSNGEAPNETNFAVATQGLANRTAYLKDEIEKAGSAKYDVTGSSEDNVSAFTLTEDFASAGYSDSGNLVTLPRTGVYLVTFDVSVTQSASTNPYDVSVAVIAAESLWGVSFSVVAYGGSTRYSSDTAQIMNAGGSGLVNISNTSTQKLYLASIGNGALAKSAVSAGQQLTITYLHPEVT
jgi:hypothetical protein